MKLIYKGEFERPAYETYQSAGFDFRSEVAVVIPPGKRAMIPTGCYLDPQESGYNAYLRIAPRSGLAHKSGLDILAGVVDEDYEGEICVVAQNLSCDSEITINPGDRIAQGIVTKIERALDVPIKATKRNGGFGHSGGA